MVVDVLGGAASYFALAAATFAPVRMVGVVGADFPPEHPALFRQCGIDLAGLQVKTGKTFRWSARYHGPRLGSRDTLDTQLNVFAGFHPQLPPQYRDSGIVFLANIQPQLQLEVLEQARDPEFVACDTMNLWIANERPALEQLFRLVHCVLVNAEEAVEFSGEEFLPAAARAILSYGPRTVIIKQGEHGSLLFTRERIFAAPAVALERVRDPTGAGDAFAGGVIGALARSGQTGDCSLRRAMLYGNALGSLAIEDFGVRRIVEAGPEEVERRVRMLAAMMSFDEASQPLDTPLKGG